MNFINDYMAFLNHYKKFTSLFNSDYIEIEWDDQIIQLFQKYDKNEIFVDPQHRSEYEVYKYVIPFYEKCFFRKNSTKYKPIIEQLPDYISYASSVFDILFKYNVFVDTEECVVYNEKGNITSACEEIQKLLIL